ncbi:ShlB/FhaC/HecB family hemolysin secretion/activation protein [Sphingosinicella sp. BN140058]|uniref:ShlB/FhaC/HecB family hemolysin secretion/activation protein n=1 Tax=Sphingosinicella sp. BN140058 TaxID=1892855 RepID=UPI0010123072|nr:ShlB/FhaC/HecB family hemolysin secretion/activation protein [Sphingosinicella sp. BN140058]QAY79490.1 ShlB/FhaC/HecB family hemolysin secretion/activation protein [Sphingosinicella sp. BN140058]
MQVVRKGVIVAVLGCWLCAFPARAEQTPVDRADPSVVREQLRPPALPPAAPAQPLLQPTGETRFGNALHRPVLAGAILIVGAEALPQSAFGSVVERYVGQTLDAEALAALAGAVANVAREAGYGLATAWIPEQAIENGVLRVRIDEGRIDAVEVTGAAAAAVQPRLARLAVGKPVRTAAIERQLLLAEDIAGVRLGKAKLERRNGRNVLVVPTFRDRAIGRAGMDNWGSTTAGPVQARVSLEASKLLSADDGLYLEVAATPFQPREFALVAGRYTVPVGTRGTELSLGGYAAWTQAGGYLRSYDLDGRSNEIEAELRHPLVRSRAAGAWLSINGRLRNSEQTLRNLLIRDDRLALLSGSLYAYHRLGNGRVRARVALVQGLDVFGATNAADPLASRFDGRGRFTKLALWTDIEQRLGKRFSIAAQAEGQFADRPLLSSEEMGLGGRRFGRAWDYREFGGDRGVAGSVELRRDWQRPFAPIEWAQLYAYADGGKVDNYRLGQGGGSLASAGGGVRLWLKHDLRGSLELGVPLTDGFAGRERSPRLSFTVDVAF